MSLKSAKFSSALRKYRVVAGSDEWFIQTNHRELFGFIWRNIVNAKGRNRQQKYYTVHEIDGKTKPKFVVVPKKSIHGTGEENRLLKAYKL